MVNVHAAVDSFDGGTELGDRSVSPFRPFVTHENGMLSIQKPFPI